MGLGTQMLAPAVFAFGWVAFGFLGMGPVTIAVDWVSWLVVAFVVVAGPLVRSLGFGWARVHAGGSTADRRVGESSGADIAAFRRRCSTGRPSGLRTRIVESGEWRCRVQERSFLRRGESERRG